MNGGPCLHYDCSNRNSFGYCRTTACCNPKYCNEWSSSTDNRTAFSVYKPPVGVSPAWITSRRRINSLAEAIARFSNDSFEGAVNTKVIRDWASEIIGHCDILENGGNAGESRKGI